MKIPEKYRLKNTIKYPTTLIVGGLSKLGLELAESLIEQGGYVIIVDAVTPELIEELGIFPEESLISFLDYSSILYLDEDIRRLDYVFYFQHEVKDFKEEISTGDFLTHSNYLDAVLSLSDKFDARFLLTTSIKAHNLLGSGSDLLDAFNDSKHSTYSAIEFQKYAEGLTGEYIKNKKLNARIVRIGEVIGEGINFYKKTAFNKLILAATQGERLELINDGLENEWYVHVMDCAYGLIKAQFAKKTEGETFSLSYDVTYTHISIAYKIQELEENAGDIYFESGASVAPSLKLRKPAQHLSRIGWFPKVSFDRAVSQSLAASKIFLIEHNAQYQHLFKEGESVSKGLDKFIALVADKKKPEIKEIEVSTQNLRNKKVGKRKKSSAAKLQDFFWKGFISFTKIFTGFKQKSPLEVAGIIVGSVLFVSFYFLLLSPFIVLFRNYFIITESGRNLEDDFSSFNITETSNNASRIVLKLEESKDIISGFTPVASVLGLETDVNSVIQSLDTYVLYFEGIEEIADGYGSYETYADTFVNPLSLRLGSDSYIDTNDSATSYEILLDNVEAKTAQIESGIAKISLAKSQLSNLRSPELLKSINSQLNTKISESEIEQRASEMLYFNEILGYKNQTDVALVVVDNTEIKPLGGSISSLGLFSLRNGAITAATIQSFEDVSLDFSEEGADISLDQINSNLFATETSSTLSKNDFVIIDDISMFETVLGDSLKNDKGFAPDLVMVITLESLIDFLDTDSVDIDLAGTQVRSDNYISVLDGLIGTNQTKSFRNNLITESFAEIVFSLTSNPRESVPTFFDILNRERAEGNILLSTEKLDYEELIKEFNWDRSTFNNSDWFAELSITNRDSSIVSRGTFPDVSVKAAVVIAEDTSTSNKIQVLLPSNIENGEVSLCLPRNIVRDSLSVRGVQESQSVIRSSGNGSICASVIVSGVSELEFIYDAGELLQTNEDSDTVRFTFPKIVGANDSVALQVDVSDEITVLDTSGNIINSPYIVQSNSNREFQTLLNIQR